MRKDDGNYAWCVRYCNLPKDLGIFRHHCKIFSQTNILFKIFQSEGHMKTSSIFTILIVNKTNVNKSDLNLITYHDCKYEDVLIVVLYNISL